MRPVSFDEFRKLKVGDKLLLRSGVRKYRIEAMVIVKDSPCATGVNVQVERITFQGDEVDVEVGHVIRAGLGELFISEPKRINKFVTK